MMDDELQEFLDATAAELGAPGAVVGVIDRDREVIAATGVAAVDTGAAVTARTLFQIGSTTKTFTGTVAMHLVESGVLGIRTPAPCSTSCPSSTPTATNRSR